MTAAKIYKWNGGLREEYEVWKVPFLMKILLTFCDLVGTETIREGSRGSFHLIQLTHQRAVGSLGQLPYLMAWDPETQTLLERGFRPAEIESKCLSS